MTKAIGIPLVLLLSATLAGAPAAAEIFTVELDNGATFDTRYLPVEDGASGQVMLLTEFGNWISLPRAAVVSVVSETETRGWGTVLDTSTIALGWSPNDLPVEEGAAPADPTQRLLDYFSQRDQIPDYSVEQFVEPEASGGIPLGFTRSTTPPLSSTGGEPPVAGVPR